MKEKPAGKKKALRIEAPTVERGFFTLEEIRRMNPLVRRDRPHK